ncbi:MAG: hypothetical protein JXB23_01205 [Candidatus Aminicenantes bacterium]|nr:hypothetical protein [Candidatus Aminicenantes bacterium]
MKIRSFSILISSVIFLSFSLGLWLIAQESKRTEKQDARSLLEEAKKLQAQMQSQLMSQVEGEGGFRAEITAHIVGPGDDVTINWYFDNIRFAYQTPYFARYLTYSGRVSGKGTSSCDWVGNYHIFHAESNLGGEAVHSSAVSPAFILDIRDEGDGESISYAFSASISPGYLRTQNYSSAIDKKWRTKGESDFETDKSSSGNIKIGYEADAASEPHARSVGWGAGYPSGGSKVGVSISDGTRYVVDKKEKCIQGRQKYPFRYTKPKILESNFLTECPASVELSWNIYLEEVVIEIDKCQYDWRPEKDGATVAITARILKPEDAVGKFRFTLYEQSNEPGYCMNAGKEDAVDLNFIENQAVFNSPEFKNVGREVPEEIMETKEEVSEATVEIQPHDYGAFGKLKAEVLICGMWYPAHEAGGTKECIDIPLDDDGNHIVDGRPQNDGKAEDDMDSEPVGDGTQGDGFTNYEEYRGFMLDDDEWEDTDINLKDFFVVFDPARLDFYAFPELSGLKCHRLDYDQMGGDDDRVVNFNYKTAHASDQHGVIVVEAILEDCGGFTRSSVWPAYPGSVEFVEVDPDKGDVEDTIPHELGHCVGIIHHGEEIEYISKALNPELPWDELCPMGVTNPDHEYCCAVWEGIHSGNENCIMRYDVANFYRWKDGNVYHYGWEKKEKNLLCSDPKGTGENAPPDRQEIFKAGDFQWVQMLPKCGDATKGDCQGQIRVKDKE